MDKSQNPLLAETRRLLRQSDLRARKGLGQHFLINAEVLEAIIAAAELGSDDLVVEVGPGLGILTRELAGRAGGVVAVELDDNLAALLKERLASFNNVTIVNGDMLKIEPKELVEGRGYKVVANLPYYITSPVLRHFLEAEAKPQAMVVMVQKEVAEAIAAKAGDMSLLSVSVQFYGSPEIVAIVPPESFYPAPAVSSAILKIDVYPQPKVDVDEKGFFDTVRAGFAAPRKQLANSLARGLGREKAEVLPFLQKAGIDPSRRAETLTVGEWAELWRVLGGKHADG
ncbi:MAG TPA: 16S rRNA (adenine(1518)-N(6)/adenine(1519)-N(6))-dimethyltransferase RsmA [Dehalococcoidales bacterium]|nr:16S rRNA (adenine(1518)-N(6)/adenine(1519)-N(6))-dimethyltransferase RsmA [Dehalococcoidales bacterium]